MSSQGKPQGQVYGMVYADARSDYDVRLEKAVVAHLQRGRIAGQVEPVVARARQSQRLAQAAWPRSDHPERRILIQSPVPCHLRDTQHRLESSQQDACPQSLALAADVCAEIPAVDEIQIGMSRRAEEHKISRCWSAMGVRCRIGHVVVRPKVGFDFDNPPGQGIALWGRA